MMEKRFPAKRVMVGSTQHPAPGSQARTDSILCYTNEYNLCNTHITKLFLELPRGILMAPYFLYKDLFSGKRLRARVLML